MTWSLAEVGRPGRPREVLDGGDVESNTGRLLSVAELQRALRATRSEARGRPVPVQVGSPAQLAGSTVAAPPPPAGLLVDRSAGPRPDPARAGLWVAVVGVHGGAGTSTVAVALADAAAAAGRGVHLVGCGGPGRCGLLAVTSAELGVDAGGHWRSGRRGPRITVDRLTGVGEGVVPWPASPVGEPGALLTVVDVEPGGGRRPRSLESAGAVLVVCRASVPGVRHAEQLLDALTSPNRLVLLAAVGAGHWPGVVASSAGPLLRQLRQDGRVVSVPVDRHLDSTGPTGTALPRQVVGAGRVLLRLLSPDLPQGAGGRRPGRARGASTVPAPSRPAPGCLLTAKDNR